jgi:hypothetical protein
MMGIVWVVFMSGLGCSSFLGPRIVRFLNEARAACGCLGDGPLRLDKMSSLPLAELLGHVADLVQGVRQGRSLTDLLPQVPTHARPGAQALTFDVLRRLGSADAARKLLAPKAPAAAVDALLVSALALLWPTPNSPWSTKQWQPPSGARRHRRVL